MEKIREKPDLSSKTTVDFDSGKATAERDKQVQELNIYYDENISLKNHSCPDILYLRYFPRQICKLDVVELIIATHRNFFIL